MAPTDTPPQYTIVNGHATGLLSKDQVFQVQELDADSYPANLVDIDANLVAVADNGFVAFYDVDALGIWNPVAAYPRGWIGPWEVIDRADSSFVPEEAEEAEEAAPEAEEEDVDVHETPPSREEIIEDVHETLRRGDFPPDVDVTPLYTRLSTILDADEPPVEAVENWTWTPGASEAEIAAWRERKREEIEAEIARLRQESDKETRERFDREPALDQLVEPWLGKAQVSE